ncbi:MAG TPA: hypothetical protein VII81_06175 [Terriglobales bacterium]
MRLRHLFPIVLILLAVSAFAQKVEKLPALDDASVPAAVKGVLDPAGSRVLLADGTPLAEVWLRKSTPKNAAAASDVLYPQLALSQMVGVVRFPNGAKDFRGHAVKPGFYTMRYLVQPNDGDHMGTSPNPDFLLMVPVADDPDPNAKMDFKQLSTASARSSGTRHPAVFEMMGPEPGDLPRAYTNADSYLIFSANLKGDDGKSFPIAVVLKGQAPQ